MKKILIVDDDDEVLQILVEYLALLFNNNVEIASAKNGEDALDKIIDAPVDLIITDVMMPVMNGVELVNELCVRNNLPIIIMISGDTGDLQQDIDIFLAEKIIKDFFTKPLEDIDMFGQRVKEFLF